MGYAEKTVEKITDGVWVIGGYSLVNCIVIEAPDGLIVYDTGDNAEEGKHFWQVIEEKISKRPIKAIIYSHYALGGGALVDDQTAGLATQTAIWSRIFDGGQAPYRVVSFMPGYHAVLIDPRMHSKPAQL